MTSVDPDRARFPNVSRGGGHYRAFFEGLDPAGGRAVWIRYTVHQRPREWPTGSLWFTFFDADARRPRAVKVTVAGPSVGLRRSRRRRAPHRQLLDSRPEAAGGARWSAAGGLRGRAGAAYELGMRERDHGMPIEAFPDG